MQGGPEVLEPEDLADRLWNILKSVQTRVQKDSAMAEMLQLLSVHSEATVARAFDRLTVAEKRSSKEDPIKDFEYRYTKNVHGLLWDLYKRVADLPELQLIDYDDDVVEPSHYTRVLMEHYQRLHNITTLGNRRRNLTREEVVKEYDTIVTRNLERDGTTLKLSVSLRKIVSQTFSSLHWDLYNGREDVSFFMPTPYLRHTWIRVDIDGESRMKKKVKRGEEKIVSFFEFPTVLSHFAMHSKESLQSLELSNLGRVRFICDGNVFTWSAGEYEETVKYSKGAARRFTKLSKLKLINLYSLETMSLADFSPAKLLTVYLQDLTACRGSWDTENTTWKDLAFSTEYTKLHTLVVSGGLVVISKIECPELKILEYGSRQAEHFPLLDPNMMLEKLILKNGVFKTMGNFHITERRDWRPPGRRNVWFPIFPTLTELRLVNVTVLEYDFGESLKQLARLNSKKSKIRVVEWNNVRVQVDFQGGAGFQEEGQDARIYGSVDPEVTSTILRRMIDCTNLTIANEMGALNLEALLRHNRNLTTLVLNNVPKMDTTLPEHTANQLVSITRPNIVFDAHAETILARRGRWRDGGLFKENEVAAVASPGVVIIDPESPLGEGLNTIEVKTQEMNELERISTWMGEIARDAKGNFAPTWILGDVVDTARVRNRFLLWEGTALRWFTRSIASEDLLLPFYEGVSMDFVFDTPEELSRTMSRHAGVNMFQTTMEYDDDTQSLFHQISFLPDEDVIQAYVDDHTARMEVAAEELAQQPTQEELAILDVKKTDDKRKGKKEEEKEQDPREEAVRAIEVNRPALIDSLKNGRASIQFRIRAGPRHEGWAFVDADPAQDTEEIGIGSTTLSFDHTFTFAPYDRTIGRGYIFGPTEGTSREVVYLDDQLDPDLKWSFPMGTLSESGDGTFRFTVACQTLMSLIGLRFLESMAFVGKDVVNLEQDIKSKMGGEYFGEQLEEVVRTLMVKSSSPAELGRPLWMNLDGTPFKVVSEDVESTVLYQEVIDPLRLFLLEPGDDAPYSKFRAHASNYLVLAYFAGRCMSNTLSRVSAATNNTTKRFSEIYTKVWTPMVQWVTRQDPVLLSFDTTRAADLFENLEEIFALVQAKRRYAIPRVDGQSRDDRLAVLDNKRSEVFSLYQKLVAGIQVLFDPHMYELMYDTHQDAYDTMERELAHVLQAYMELDAGGRNDAQTNTFKIMKDGPLSDALNERITTLFRMIEEFFIRALRVEEEAALNMSLQEDDDDDDGDFEVTKVVDNKGKGEEGEEDDEDESSGSSGSSESPGSPMRILASSPSRRIIYMRHDLTVPPRELIQNASMAQIDRLSGASSEAERVEMETFFVIDQNSLSVLDNAQAAMMRRSRSSTPTKSPSPSKSQASGGMFTSPIEQIVSSKRRASQSPESLRTTKRSPPTELLERRPTASGGVHQSVKQMTDAQRAAFLRRGVGALETARVQNSPDGGETLRNKKGIPQRNTGVRNAPPIVIDLVTPSPDKKKRVKVEATTPLSTSERKRREAAEAADAKEITPRRLNFEDDDIYDSSSSSSSGINSTINKRMVIGTKICANCSSKAVNRCARCKSAHYCGRECQVQHFEKHRHECKEKQ